MKTINRFLAIIIMLCSLLFYVPNPQNSYASSVTHNGVVYYPITSETFISNDIGYLQYSSYDEETETYLYDKNSSFFKYNSTNENVISSYFLDVLEIAETENNELIVYVFEPYFIDINDEVIHYFGESHAKSINISVNEENLNFINYKLEPISRLLEHKFNTSYYYVIYKYKVKDFVVGNNSTRYYEFSTLYSDIMPNGQEVGLQENGQTINEFGYSVACKYKYTTNENGSVSVDKQDSIVINVTDMFVGYARYKNTAAPSWIDKNSCDRHFVAFTTDMRIDRLKEADVYFVRQDIAQVGGFGNVYPTYGNKIEDYAYLKYTQQAEITNQGGWFWSGYTYSWNRIQTVNNFISSVDMTTVYSKAIFDISAESTINSESRQELENQQWVLSFYESDFTDNYVSYGSATMHEIERTAVGEVSLLRLRFITDGVEYNLGAISNKQTGSLDPINDTTTSVSLNKDWLKDIWQWMKIILGILALVLIFALLAPFLPTIFSFIGLILKGIFNIISLPFEAIKSSKKRKGKK